MLKINVSGLDKVQRELQEMQRAFAALDGQIATVSFTPSDPESVERAIAEMEKAVDERVAPFRGNSAVTDVVKKMKASYREQILEKARSENAEPAGHPSSS